MCCRGSLAELAGGDPIDERLNPLDRRVDMGRQTEFLQSFERPCVDRTPVRKRDQASVMRQKFT